MHRNEDIIHHTMDRVCNGTTIFSQPKPTLNNAGTSEGVKKAWETRRGGGHGLDAVYGIADASGARYAGAHTNQYGATVHTYHVDIPENDTYNESIAHAEEKARRHMLEQGMSGLGGGSEGGATITERSVIEPGPMMKETRHRFIARPKAGADDFRTGGAQ